MQVIINTYSKVQIDHISKYQQWVMVSYQHSQNFPLTKNPIYSSLMDLQMTYEQDSDIPISLYCPWGDGISTEISYYHTSHYSYHNRFQKSK